MPAGAPERVTPVKHAVSVVVLRGGPQAVELLTVRRPPDDEDLPDVWGLPAASLRPGESWWEAARRAGRDKLGVELARFRLRRQESVLRRDHTLFMRLFEAELAAGEPRVPQRVEGVTQYAECAWTPPARLEAAAGRGSSCSRLCLEWLGAGVPQRRVVGEPEAELGGSASPAGTELTREELAVPEAELVRVGGVVVRGHGVASGQSPSPYVAGGTIRAQLSAFRERGLDLSGFHPATLNISIAPGKLAWHHPRATFREVKWHPELPAETFSFSPCLIEAPDAEGVDRGASRSAPGASGVVPGASRSMLGASGVVPGWLYLPHPETKPRDHQPDEVVEVLAERLEGVGYGSRITLWVDPAEVRPGR